MDIATTLGTLLKIVGDIGVFIIPLCLASVLTGALVLEQSWYSFLAGRRIKRLHLSPEQWDRLWGMDMISRMLRSLVQNYHASEEVQKRDLDLIYTHFERRVLWLNTVGAVAPMLGLIGTVSGMIRIFATISEKQVKNPLQELSGGLSEALYATGAGLIIAIVAALSYHLLNARLEAAGKEMVSWYEAHRNKLRLSR